MNPPQARPSAGDWRQAGLRYNPLGRFLRARFGAPVRRITVDAGMDCPNRDGTIGLGGCTFCNPASFSAARRRSLRPVAEQVEDGCRRIVARGREVKYLVYFQPGTNTYAPPDRLEHLYNEALSHPDVVGLAVATRPDCLSDEVLELLAQLARETWVLLELGLQSVHDETLHRIHRGHEFDAFRQSVARARQRGLFVGAHVILGLPGERLEHMLATAEQLGRQGVGLVKLHNFHLVRDTPLAAAARNGRLALPTLGEYAGWVAAFLERLRPECVIDRVSGDAPPDYLIGPDWCRDKHAVRRAVENELRRRDTWQGRLWPPSP